MAEAVNKKQQIETLPENAQDVPVDTNLKQAISDFLQVKIEMVSVGKDRNANVFL